MKKYVVQGLAILLIALFTSLVLASEAEWENIGKENMHIESMLVEAGGPRMVYFGSRDGVFKSEDAGKNWRSVLSVRGQNRNINFILADPQNKNSLFAATGAGLYSSANQGKNWKRIFQGKNVSEDECASVLALPKAIYLGTKAGLFVSLDKGRSWHKESGQLSDSRIFSIASRPQEPEIIYVACLDGVFKTADSGKNWERIFVVKPGEDGGDREEENEDQDEEEKLSIIRYLALDPNNSDCLYSATTKGVYQSRDRGKSWVMLSDYGLLSREVKFILVTFDARILCVAKSGIFEFKYDRWYELSLRLTAGEVNFLSYDNQANIYAGCDKGLFKAKASVFNPDAGAGTLELYLKNEPKISAVQQAAIKYAEVEPEKIIRWRKQAAKKAWLPKLSADLGRNTTDLWHWETGSSAIGQSGDDLLRRGKDSLDWDVSVSWDFSELVWSDNQTSIDVRSRLTAQLRDDILDDVNKTYFERIRVKMELDNFSIEDRKKRLEKELRLEELTASLDALTGGYFSRESAKMKSVENQYAKR